MIGFGYKNTKKLISLYFGGLTLLNRCRIWQVYLCNLKRVKKAFFISTVTLLTVPVHRFLFPFLVEMGLQSFTVQQVEGFRQPTEELRISQFKWEKKTQVLFSVFRKKKKQPTLRFLNVSGHFEYFLRPLWSCDMDTGLWLAPENTAPQRQEPFTAWQLLQVRWCLMLCVCVFVHLSKI